MYTMPIHCLFSLCAKVMSAVKVEMMSPFVPPKDRICTLLCFKRKPLTCQQVTVLRMNMFMYI